MIDSVIDLCEVLSQYRVMLSKEFSSLHTRNLSQVAETKCQYDMPLLSNITWIWVLFESICIDNAPKGRAAAKSFHWFNSTHTDSKTSEREGLGVTE